ncbi:hypothetical protein ABT272_31165 [Streptomyces sp900105245]|uniref:Uncharacterized protein n=1 Tax=Streptomyces sp. 900105245 TaxID=3154379 RepID=A0ABV1UEK9_9ACTN
MFVEPAEAQTRTFDLEQTARLDAALNVIAADPAAVKKHATASALHDYQHEGIRIVFYATALGSILIVTYVEVD